MKKTCRFTVMVLIIALVITGCNRQNIQHSQIEQSPFFFPKGVTSAKYDIEYELDFDALIEKGGGKIDESLSRECTEVILNINKLAENQYGILYELKFAPTIRPSNGNLILGYYYVDNEKICKLRLEHNETLNLDDREKMAELLNRADIVCNENGIADIPEISNPNTKEVWHKLIEIYGDKRTFRYYSDYTDGTRYYEDIVWERGKGLVEYRSGFGAKSQGIELTLIEN